MSSELTRQCLTFENRSSTPPHVKKYRRSTYLEPGKRHQHYGVVDDFPELQLDNKVFGMIDEPTRDSAADLIHQPTMSELQRMNVKKSERTYKHTIREPLGHSPERNTVLPTKFTEGKEPFGVKTKSTVEAAKNIIFPVNNPDTGDGNDLYKRSHGSYQPGEQRNRNYQWNLDPKTTRFGVKGDTIALNGVSKNIAEVLKGTVETDLKNSSSIPIVNRKNVEDFYNLKDSLGKTKNLGQDSANRPAGIVYGKPSGVKGLSAAEVIRGKYSPADLQPDRDLGKSITPGFRNLTFTDRAYGVPSIRNDIPALPYSKRSLADSQNYGDDVPAQNLINPPAFADLSIGPYAMAELKSKEKIYELFHRIGFDFNDRIFDEVFDQASNGSSSCSINDFRTALNDYIIQNNLV